MVDKKLDVIKKMEDKAKKHYEVTKNQGNPVRQSTEIQRAVYFQNQVLIKQNEIIIELLRTWMVNNLKIR